MEKRSEKDCASGGPVWVVWVVGSSSQDVSGNPKLFALFMMRVSQISGQNIISGPGAISARSRRDLGADLA